MIRSWTFIVVLSAFVANAASVERSFAADAPKEKPKVAVFPLGGNAADDLRERVGFSLRTKLDRDGTYEPIDGPAMADMVAGVKDPVTFETSPAVVKSLADGSGAVVLIWGDLSTGAVELGTLRVKVLNLRQPDATPREIIKPIHAPTDVRFVVEGILQSLSGVAAFEHPSEESVTHDAKSDALWAANPNLCPNGDFSKAESWEAIYQSEQYPVKFSDALPEEDKVCIYRMPIDGGGSNPVLAMNLSNECAENNGMACRSDLIPIEPKTRYRLSFRYQSTAPTLHVFVKGYTMAPDINGKLVPREIYRRQVPPSGATDEQWQTVIDDMNPQHIHFPVQYLRIDLYAYLKPGVVLFDDVVLKAVGDQTHQAKDDAMKPPATQPARAH